MGSFDMIQIEEFKHDTKQELHTRERYWIEELKATLNKVIPTRTDKEWQIDNREVLKIKKAEYQQNNKEVIALKRAEYREKIKKLLKFKCLKNILVGVVQI